MMGLTYCVINKPTQTLLEVEIQLPQKEQRFSRAGRRRDGGKISTPQAPASRVHPSQTVPEAAPATAAMPNPCDKRLNSPQHHGKSCTSCNISTGISFGCRKYGPFLLLPSCFSFNYKGTQMKRTLKTSWVTVRATQGLGGVLQWKGDGSMPAYASPGVKCLTGRHSCSTRAVTSRDITMTWF